MQQKINVTLPAETLRLIDRMAPPGGRSRFIEAAIKPYAEAIGEADLERQLKERAIARAARDLQLAEEWFPACEIDCAGKKYFGGSMIGVESGERRGYDAGDWSIIRKLHSLGEIKWQHRQSSKDRIPSRLI